MLRKSSRKSFFLKQAYRVSKVSSLPRTARSNTVKHGGQCGDMRSTTDDGTAQGVLDFARFTSSVGVIEGYKGQPNEIRLMGNQLLRPAFNDELHALHILSGIGGEIAQSQGRDIRPGGICFRIAAEGETNFNQCFYSHRKSSGLETES